MLFVLQEVRVDGQFPLPAGATDRRGLSPNDYGTVSYIIYVDIVLHGCTGLIDFRGMYIHTYRCSNGACADVYR